MNGLSFGSKLGPGSSQVLHFLNVKKVCQSMSSSRKKGSANGLLLQKALAIENHRALSATVKNTLKSLHFQKVLPKLLSDENTVTEPLHLDLWQFSAAECRQKH